ncbi:hypothetical protein CEK26_003740 [Fusarium fujikuroi]|nr:Uncharacterized protein LW93_5992 [Fusarium fujikuroi]QGJ02296.1 hypothetical protein CEK26_003740 [Fusarium fujikuroi]
MLALASLVSWLWPEPVFQLEPGTPPINHCLWNLAAVFTGGHIGITHMLLLVPAVFVYSVIMPTRILSLLPSPAGHPKVEIFWPVVLLGFGTTVASSWALTNQGPTLLLWVPVYCFTFGVVPYLLQLVVLKFPSCSLPIATLLAWILVVESLLAIERYGWSESLIVRHRSTVCLVLAETFAYAMQWVEWPLEGSSAI